jgi:uncharacterized protein YbjT (DUF2867 family)
MILVAGATGFLGGEICRRLAASGRTVRGLVRKSSDPATVAALRAAGVETVEGDLRDPTSLAAACAGVHTVVSTVTTTRSRQEGETLESTDAAGQINLIDAAAAAGVARFVYISYSGNITGDDPLTRAKRGAEARLRASGMTYTILRPSYFMEVWLGPHLGLDWTNARATVFGSGDAKVSWVSLGDVASFAVRAVDDARAANAVIEIGGPEALSRREAIGIFEREIGQSFAVEAVPEAALEAQAASAPDSLSRAFGALMLRNARGDVIPMDETLRTFPVTLTSVRDYARRVLHA